MTTGLFLSVYLVTILSFLGGLYIGTRFQREEFKEDIQRVRKTVSKITGKPQSGLLRRPSAEYLREKGTIIEETKNAMKESLDELLT